MIILFKHCSGVENCESFKDFGYIYIYQYDRINMTFMGPSLPLGGIIRFP